MALTDIQGTPNDYANFEMTRGNTGTVIDIQSAPLNNFPLPKPITPKITMLLGL